MKILSWNVNGLRAVLRKEALQALEPEEPDIVCLQETKLQEGQIDPVLTDFPWQYWNYAERRGYSGTVIFCREEPREVRLGLGKAEHDKEGRLITLEFPAFFLVNTYTPNAQHELARLPYRQKWDRALLSHLKKLNREKPVVLCGDLNVAHQEIDLARPKENRGSAGFSDEEREGLTRILKAGFLDTFRLYHQEGGNYTWWSYIFNARAKNIGWRIDYFLISEALIPALTNAFILPEIMGSDHCPVGIDLDNKNS